MKRRDFILGLGVAAVWLVAGHAQQSKVYTVGVLVLGNPSPKYFMQVVRTTLKNAGYIEGKNIQLEYRSADGKTSALAGLAAELVRLKVDVILAFQTPPAIAAKKATNHIPIVMARVGDPLGTGLVASLARPGGNVTGTTAFGSELAEKSVEIMRDMLPSMRRLAVLATIGDPFARPFLTYIEGGGRRLGMEVHPIMLRPNEDFEPAFKEMRSKQIDAVFVQPTLMRGNISELALKYRLPSISLSQTLPQTGGLISYSAKRSDLYRESTLYVVKVLKGENPVNLPVSQPTTFEMIINGRTAKALGLTVPSSLLARADEVIE